MKVNKDFLSHTEALALKELGFDEPCFSHHTFIAEDGIDWFTIPELGLSKGKVLFGRPINYNTKLYEKEGAISAPTYSEAFRWFREKHKLSAIVSQFGWGIENEYGVIQYNIDEFENPLCYEESELSCLKKLIELVKNK